MTDQEKDSIDAALRSLRKRSLNERELRETPLHREKPLPPKLSDLESSSLEQKEIAKEQTPRREPKQSDIPVRREPASSDRSESLNSDNQSTGNETGVAEGEPSRDVPRRSQGSGYDSRDVEIGQAVSGMKQEKFKRDKKSSEQGMRFAKAGASFVGRMLGGAIGKGARGIPSELKSALGSTVGDMFGGSDDASVSSEGNGGSPDNSDVSVKMDRIIELLSQLVQASGKSDVAGPQADGSFTPSPDLAQAVARHATGSAAGAAGASITKSNKDSSSDDMMGVLLQTLMKAAIAAV